MIEIDITQEHIERAKKYYSFHNIKNSITKGKSENYGALGEAIVMDYYDLPESAYQPTKDHDILFNGKTVDVKTKKTSTKPKPHYFASVTCKSYEHQNCDYYCFIRINNEMTKAWICGFIRKDYLTKHGVKYLKGQPDPTSYNGFQFKDDCWNIPLSELNLSKSDKITSYYLKSLGFEIEIQKDNILITNYKKSTINGFDEKIRILVNNNTQQIVIQKTNEKTLFEGYLCTQNELKTVCSFLKLIL